MTPERLERKRAHDRISQRAARERTKQYIRRLEQEIKELRLQLEQGQTLEEMTQRNESLASEVTFLRKCLELNTNGLSSQEFQVSLDYVQEPPPEPFTTVPKAPAVPTMEAPGGPINVNLLNYRQLSTVSDTVTSTIDRRHQHVSWIYEMGSLGTHGFTGMGDTHQQLRTQACSSEYGAVSVRMLESESGERVNSWQ